MLSPTAKKRSHSEDTAVEEACHQKKTKILDSPTSLPYESDSSLSPQPSNDCSNFEKPLTTTEKKRNKRRTLYASTLELVKNDTTVKTLNRIPYAKLKANAQWSTYLNLPDFAQLPSYEQQGWRLCAILFEKQQGEKDKDDAQRQAIKFKQWWIQTVSAGAEAAIQSIKRTEPNDPYAEIFTAMTFGRISDATSLAVKKNDYTLAIFLSSPMSPKNAVNQRKKLSSTAAIKSDYHAKIWQALSGEVDSNVTDGLDWKQTLMLYILYGKTRPGEDPLNTLLGRYFDKNNTTTITPAKSSSPPSSSNITTTATSASTTAASLKARDSSPWYNVVKWWWQRTYNSQNPTTVNVSAWPARLAWRFAISFADDLSPTLVASIVRRWCTELQVIGLADMALFASLFISSKENVVSILSRSPFVANEYNVPESWIKEAQNLWNASLTVKKNTPRSVAESL
ncbi:nuclear protein 96-domain-containing protein [Zychaea mexicana]|uniref:nuclear protein 96-domain-containing protein n=1 Tax=Zychaea mexicana TaxID=64656 RepID=UPI0022FE0FE0|nr:nuclear protein 96-domain-containing protein [Zychaea mexicana]KAI9496630.1 nuclear protein 96-domain-containing protein [Zychaea mexicana]